MTVQSVSSATYESGTASEEEVHRDIPKWGTAKKVAVCSLNLLASPLWCGVFGVGAAVYFYQDQKTGYVNEYREASRRFRMRCMLKGMIPIYNAFYMTKQMEQAIRDNQTRHSSLDEE